MFNAVLWLYANRHLYRLMMRLLYGRYFEARYAAIAAEIPPKTKVIDVCAGDGYLYYKYLSQKEVDYLGLDLSPQLVRWANQHSTAAREFDLWENDLPACEIIVMQASLYQFSPHTKAIMHKLLAAARQKVIISEPIRNLAASQNPLLAWMSHHLTIPDSIPETYTGQRFDERALETFFREFEAFKYAFVVPGGREMVGIFKGQYRDCGRE